MKTAAIFLAWMAWTAVNYVAPRGLRMKFADRCLEEMLPPLAQDAPLREDPQTCIAPQRIGSNRACGRSS